MLKVCMITMFTLAIFIGSGALALPCGHTDNDTVLVDHRMYLTSTYLLKSSSVGVLIIVSLQIHRWRWGTAKLLFLKNIRTNIFEWMLWGVSLQLTSSWNELRSILFSRLEMTYRILCSLKDPHGFAWKVWSWMPWYGFRLPKSYELLSFYHIWWRLHGNIAGKQCQFHKIHYCLSYWHRKVITCHLLHIFSDEEILITYAVSMSRNNRKSTIFPKNNVNEVLSLKMRSWIFWYRSDHTETNHISELYDSFKIYLAAYSFGYYGVRSHRCCWKKALGQ